MFEEKIKPPLVLTLICIITCGLLVAAYEATYVDDTGVITEKLSAGLTEIYGSADGFSMLKNDDGSVFTAEGVTSVLSDGTNTAFEITANGYSTGGLHVLIGVNENGEIGKIAVLTIGETPGVGTKVQDESFLSQFTGLKYDMTVTEEKIPVKSTAVWGTRAEIDDLSANVSSDGTGFVLDAVTGATFSSNGMYSAVRTALSAFEQMKGESVNG